MKKIITAALLLIVMQAQSQTFEGTVKWSMKSEITDPKIKAQMDITLMVSMGIRTCRRDGHGLWHQSLVAIV